MFSTEHRTGHRLALAGAGAVRVETLVHIFEQKIVLCSGTQLHLIDSEVDSLIPESRNTRLHHQNKK